MEICSLQVIYLLCLMGGGAGRDVHGEGEPREIGNSGVISGGGDGRGLLGLSELVPHHVRVRGWRFPKGAALLGQTVAILAVARRPPAF